nr:GbpC/Spa domain-containing protein [uncultured Shuttleworthia sp.]
MKGKSRAISKKLSAITLSCLVMFGTVGAVLPTYAADPVKGIEIKADRTELDQSVSDAKNAGAEIVQDADVDKGVVKSEAEADSKRAEIEADYKQQVQQLKDAKKAAQKYSQDKKKYDEAKKKYDAELAKYNVAKKKYDDELTAYNKAMEELEKKKNEDGYMSVPSSQTLQFKSEPSASMQFLNGGKAYSQTEWKTFFDSNIGSKLGIDQTQATNDFNYINNVANAAETRVMLHKGQPLKVAYTNLQNSYVNGKKIARVEYTYTLRDTGISGVNDLPALIEKDPTVTIWYLNSYGQADFNLTADFYDGAGHKIDMTGALFNFSSLNHGTGTSSSAPSAVGKPMIEKVLRFNGDYIYISGSSVTKQADGGAYASNDNDSKAKGSRFSTSEWDDSTSGSGKPTWYGAIVGKAKGTSVSVDIGASKRGVVWFALNSDIKALPAPVKPVAPVPPTEPEEPQKPEQVSYHYDILYVQEQVEKKVLDENNTDINNLAIKTASVVKFALHVSDIPAGHETIDSLVFNDILPSDYEVDAEATKQASADYDVTYDATTRHMVFTANAALLARINRDPTKAAKVPAPLITGKVTKEGKTYVNDFGLTINNTYSVKSNPVRVHTPTKPKKDVFTGSDTTSIDGKVVQPGQELRYELNLHQHDGKQADSDLHG